VYQSVEDDDDLPELVSDSEDDLPELVSCSDDEEEEVVTTTVIVPEEKPIDDVTEEKPTVEEPLDEGRDHANPIESETLGIHYTGAMDGNYKSMTAPLKCDNWICKGLVDTGASVSIMSIDLFHIISEANPKYVLMDKPATLPISASGHSLDIIGEVFVPITIEDSTAWVNVLVASTFHYPIILGTDALHALGVNIDFGTGMITTPKGKQLRFAINAIEHKRQDDRLYAIVAPFDMMIPARSHLPIKGRVIGLHDKNVPLFISSTGGDDYVYVANTVSEMNDKSLVTLEVMNITGDAVPLKKGDFISYASVPEAIQNEPEELEFEENDTEELLEKLAKGMVVTSEQKKIWKSFMRAYGFTSIFAKNPKQPGSNTRVTHKIRLTEDKVVFQPPYRYSVAEREIIRQHTKEMKDNGIIRSSHSSYAAPVVLAKKKDGSWRFCVDYRKLNAITKRDVYPLPRIDDTLDALSKAKYFSTLDLASDTGKSLLMKKTKKRLHLLLLMDFMNGM
jgi:hypothetical protein